MKNYRIGYNAGRKAVAMEILDLLQVVKRGTRAAIEEVAKRHLEEAENKPEERQKELGI